MPLSQDWYHATQRDFTTLSINDSYQPISAVFKGTLPRILLQAGLVSPQEYSKDKGTKAAISSNDNPFPDSVTEKIMSSLGTLQPRPGMVQAFTKTYRDEKLVSSKFKQVELWGATNGGLALSEKLFKGALGSDVSVYTGQGISSKQRKPSTRGQGVGLFSCDEIKMAKPHPDVYRAIRSRIEEEGDATSLWFVASHTWDLFAAKKAGFKTAWVGYEEFFTCPDIFMKPDVTAKDLNEAAEKILAREGQ
jgi:phosphoglycolate phosphatase-like HAD superfamily hydrolase